MKKRKTNSPWRRQNAEWAIRRKKAQEGQKRLSTDEAIKKAEEKNEIQV